MKRIISISILIILLLGTIPVYADSIEPFVGDYTKFEKNNKYGIVDRDGNITIEPKWDAVRFMPMKMAAMKIGNKMGVLDVATGRIIIKPKWSDIRGVISDKWIHVTEGSYSYILDITTGKEDISSEFSTAHYVYSIYIIPYFKLEDGSKVYTFLNGKTITLESQYMLKGFSSGVGTITKGGKYGLIDINGKVILEPEWDYMEKFIEEVTTAKKGDKTFVIDTTGKVIFESKWDDVGNFYEGIAVVSKDDKYGLIDRTGKIISEPQWDELVRNYNSYEMPSIVRKGNKYGYINTLTGKVIIDQLDSAWAFSDGMASVIKNHKRFFIDTTGKVTFEFPWNGGNFINGACTIFKDNNVGFIDRTGKVISKPQWDGTLGFHEGLAAVRKGEKWEYMNWDDWQQANPGSIPAGGIMPGEPVPVLKEKGKWGFIDINGNLIIDVEYDEVRNFQEGRAVVLKDGKWGFIDKTGRMIFQIDK